MSLKRILIEDIYKNKKIPLAGGFYYITGEIIIMRDTAHKRFIQNNEKKIDFNNKAIFYAGPLRSGILGPTTSSRMDPFTLWFAKERGVRLFIGKGKRDESLVKILRNMGVYCASVPGGISSYLSKNIQTPESILYKELGCESIFVSKVRHILVQFL